MSPAEQGMKVPPAFLAILVTVGVALSTGMYALGNLTSGNAKETQFTKESVGRLIDSNQVVVDAVNSMKVQMQKFDDNMSSLADTQKTEADRLINDEKAAILFDQRLTDEAKHTTDIDLRLQAVEAEVRAYVSDRAAKRGDRKSEGQYELER